VGARWSPIYIIARSQNGRGTNYPTPIVDEEMGIVHLFYSDFGVGEFRMSTHDGGHAWTPPIKLDGALAKGAFMNGVQLNGGRLVVPCTRDDVRTTCYSDDHGVTWLAGSILDFEMDANIRSLTTDATAWSRALDSDDDLTTHNLGGCGETSIAADGRGVRTLTLFCRRGTSALVNHALAISNDGGETWSLAQPLSGVVGPTCQGSIGPARTNGIVLVSAPFSHDGSLNGRENLALWAVNVTQHPFVAKLRGRLWGCKGAYTAFSQDGTRVLFEAGTSFRYESIMLAHLEGLVP